MKWVSISYFAKFHALEVTSYERIICFGLLSLKQQRDLLLHEVMHLRVDSFNDGHQIVKNVFCVVHGRIHEVPEKKAYNKEPF